MYRRRLGPSRPRCLVLPYFGWQRQTETNLKRSVGLEAAARLPSSVVGLCGEGELSASPCGNIERRPQRCRSEKYSHSSAMGMDPIWQTGNLYGSRPVQLP